MLMRPIFVGLDLEEKIPHDWIWQEFVDLTSSHLWSGGFMVRELKSLMGVSPLAMAGRARIGHGLSSISDEREVCFWIVLMLHVV